MEMPAKVLAERMWHYWIKHVDRKNGEELYRIFYYDCPPLEIKAEHPITKEQLNFAKSDIAKYQNDLHNALLHQPYVACRMGYLNTNDKEWGFIRDNSKNIKKLIRGDLKPEDINPNDISLKPTQKGVDMKLGIDITTVVLKKLANKIILISGDSDFVPAAKQARVEGAHIILDAMGRNVTGELSEHIDGLKTYIGKIKPIEIKGPTKPA